MTLNRLSHQSPRVRISRGRISNLSPFDVSFNSAVTAVPISFSSISVPLWLRERSFLRSNQTTDMPGQLRSRGFKIFSVSHKGTKTRRNDHNPQPQFRFHSHPSPCLCGSVRDHFFDRTRQLTCLASSARGASKSFRFLTKAQRHGGMITTHNRSSDFILIHLRVFVAP